MHWCSLIKIINKGIESRPEQICFEGRRQILNLISKPQKKCGPATKRGAKA